MDPYVALMRRYCIDYTSVHDQSLCAELMADDYEITISGRTLDMAAYTEAVAAAFRRYPTLVLSTHEMIRSGDRLAMRFSEHGAAADDPDHVAVWQGISLYRWDGRQLRTCRVEQDFLGRDAQTASGVTAALEPPHPDPWATTRDRDGDPAAEAAVRAWIDRLAASPGEVLAGDDVRLMESEPNPRPLLSHDRVAVDDLFSAAATVAAALTVHGTYEGGLPGVDDAVRGTAETLPLTLLADVADGEVRSVRLVRDCWGLVRRLRKAARG